MPGMRKGITKEETYNRYGEAAMEVEIEQLGGHETFLRVSRKGPLMLNFVKTTGLFTQYNICHRNLDMQEKTHTYMAKEGQMPVFARKVPDRRSGQNLMSRNRS